jgi:hypothetical protein
MLLITATPSVAPVIRVASFTAEPDARLGGGNRSHDRFGRRGARHPDVGADETIEPAIVR